MNANPLLQLGAIPLLMLLSSSIASGQSTEANREYDQVIDNLSQVIAREIQQKDIPAFSIALVDGDQIVWSEGFGLSDPHDQRAATADTIYRAGSVSKLLTDIAVMQLIEQGKLELDSEIQEFLPDFQPHNAFGEPITLRRLMNHRSGLVRESPIGHYFDANEPTLAQTVYSLNETTLVHAPGTKTKYSNAAVSVAGLAIEQVMGMPFERHMQQSLLEPLQMDSSGFVRTEVIDSRLATAFMWTLDGRRFEAPKFTLGTLPAGNLYSTVRDLGNLMRAIFGSGELDGRQVISAAMLEEMLVPGTGPDGQQRQYGIGFRISHLDGNKTFEHGGAVYGFATQFRGLPEEKLGVVAVASLDCANGSVSRIANHALRLMLAQKASAPLPQLEATTAISVATARNLAGLYQRDNQTLRLFESGGQLRMQHGSEQHVVRAAGNRNVVDDVLGFGPYLDFDGSGNLNMGGVTWTRVLDLLPDSAPPDFDGLIGEYGWDHNTLFIYEEGGQLWALIEWFYHYPLTQESSTTFAFPDYGLYHDEKLIFDRDSQGRASRVVAAEVDFPRRDAGPAQGETFKIQPLLPPHRLREIALADQPPAEPGDFLPADLVELTALDPTIKLDIRYSTTNNFMDQVFYQQARAFMQRPAAEALLRAHQQLKERGYGLLIHDAYRPWFVTKMFYEATPLEFKHFVADPNKGSRHNRGCAVDLTLYELETGRVVPMVAGYDEFSARAYPDYTGGTSRQRWHRRLLRQTMEAAGFEIYEFEWWHFDFHQWQLYGISNKIFSEIGGDQ